MYRVISIYYLHSGQDDSPTSHRRQSIVSPQVYVRRANTVCHMQVITHPRLIILRVEKHYPDSKVHGANMGPIWVRQDPGGPHVGHMNFAFWVSLALNHRASWYCYSSTAGAIYSFEDRSQKTKIPVSNPVIATLDNSICKIYDWKLKPR